MKVTRREFFQILGAGAASVALPAVAFKRFQPVDAPELLDAAQIEKRFESVDWYRRDVISRLDLAGAPWMVYYSVRYRDTDWEFCELLDEEPTEAILARVDVTARMAIRRGIARHEHELARPR